METYKKVIRMFRSGLAPSEIDKALELPKGSAHDLIVHFWRSLR